MRFKLKHKITGATMVSPNYAMKMCGDVIKLSEEECDVDITQYEVLMDFGHKDQYNNAIWEGDICMDEATIEYNIELVAGCLVAECHGEYTPLTEDFCSTLEVTGIVNS